MPEDTSPDDARLQLKAAHDTAEPQNPVSRLRDLVMVRYDRQLLCAVYDGELNLYDTLTYMKTDVTAGRLRYEAQPESYLLAAIRAGSATATAPASQRPSLKSIDFITLAEALNFVAGTIDVPTGRATAEDESMWRASEAAGVLHERLSNASGNRPRWVQVHETTGKPLFNDAVADEGMDILLHAAGWYDRQIAERTGHALWCVKAGLDPRKEPPVQDPNGGQWDYSRYFLREHGIGFVRAELSSLLGMSLGAVTGTDRTDARTILAQQYARLDHIAWAMVILALDAPAQGETRYRQIHGVTQWLESMGLQFRTSNGLPASQHTSNLATGMDVREYQYLAVADVRSAATLAQCWPRGADSWDNLEGGLPWDNQAVSIIHEPDARELSSIGLTTEDWDQMSLSQRLSAAKSMAATKEIVEQVARQADERRAVGRYTLTEAAKAIAATGERFEALEEKLCGAAERGNLPMYGPGERARYEYTNGKRVRPFYEEAYWGDLNAWLKQNEPRITFCFAAPAGAVQMANASPLDAAGAANITMHRIRTRTDPLQAIIEKAKNVATDRDDYHSVWAVIVDWAQGSNRTPPLLGYAEAEGVKWESHGNVKFFTKDALRKRMNPRAR